MTLQDKSCSFRRAGKAGYAAVLKPAAKQEDDKHDHQHQAEDAARVVAITMKSEAGIASYGKHQQNDEDQDNRAHFISPFVSIY